MAQRYAAPYPPDMLREPLLDSGFEIWHNAPNPDDHSFQIVGSEFSQVIELQVPPGQTITAEPGTMLFMSSGMDMDADMGGLSQGCTRCCCAGESMFRLKMLNKTGSIEKIALTPRVMLQSMALAKLRAAVAPAVGGSGGGGSSGDNSGGS
ncbi:hypothetical protein CEUSTIGMA_g1919.t1 [Chlamydomonas eustigma]|uniref:Uncharacterized protein n=1 Tax=Chlamydomonas eustigma TaxID=1157962 RepID=A0A250WVA9_9CHLO|nr:hypothetical protein CEUSTIGMA_g1919.t1 [Chlamydomonas eustigma]|eukprot:GAX74470.1 hypothetical protein CEUSTIGMA_g1919.t1 [Chlamydomonas eustigma]